MTNVLDIVWKALKEQGFDGLYADGGCACDLSDLAPCGEMRQDCEAGYKHIVTAEDIESGRFDHFDEPPSIPDVGKYWVIMSEKQE